MILKNTQIGRYWVVIILKSDQDKESSICPAFPSWTSG